MIKPDHNRLTIIGSSDKRGNQRNIYVKCRCECGTIKDIMLSRIKSNHTKSCGCLRQEQMRILGNQTKHGLRYHPLYTTFYCMKSRCYNKKDIAYKNYGDRGIIICDEWKNDFKQFYDWAIEKWQPGLEIDRIDTNGNYEPDNCRFVTSKIQNNNTRRNTYIQAFNESKTIAEWADDSRCKVKYNTLVYRLYHDWSPEDAISISVPNKEIQKCN